MRRAVLALVSVVAVMLLFADPVAAKPDTIGFDASVDLENATAQFLHKGKDVTAKIVNGDFRLKHMPAGASSKAFSLIQTIGSGGGSVETLFGVASKNNPLKVDLVRALSTSP